jgi:hypothetical protein
MGWMCSVEALGPPQTQTGTWVSLEDGTTEAPKSAQARLDVEFTRTADGVVS